MKRLLLLLAASAALVVWALIEFFGSLGWAE